MVFSELTLETPVCTLGVKWRGKGEEDKEMNKNFPGRQNNMENRTREESKSWSALIRGFVAKNDGK